jgi:hypothetical protein
MSDENEVNKLIEGETIEGHLIKPWTICDLKQLSPVFEQIYLGVLQRGVDWKEWQKDFAKIVFAALPSAPEIIVITLKMSMEDVHKIPAGVDVKLLSGIIRVNLTYLKNSLIPTMMEMIQIVHN